MLKRFVVHRNVIALLLALLVLAAGCGPGPAQPTEVPTPTPTEIAVEVPDDVRAARDAALAYVSENYPDQVPPPGLTWAEESTTPEGLVGWVTYEFRAEDWVITIGTAVVPPEMRRYEVMVDNPASGFYWEGRVDAEGRVAEGPEIVLTARDAALDYVIEHYPEQAPSPDLIWEGGRTTPEGLIGSETFQYTAEEWVVTISYPVVAPEEVIYQIVVENPTTGFRWEGELDAERYLTETAAEDEYVGWKTYTSEKFGYTLKYPGDAEVMGPNLDESVQFVGPIVNDEHWPWFFVEHYDSDFYHPPSGTDVHQWIADSDVSYDEIGPEVEIAGLSTVHLIYNESPQAYASDDYYFIRGDQLFHITILHAGGQQDWDLYNKFLQGFTFTTEVAVEGQPVVCWYGHVVSLAEGAQFDDYLSLLPEGAGEIGVEGASAEIEAQIEGLRDKEEPGKYAHFWGTLTCPVLDYGGCQLVVTRLRPGGPEGPFFDPDPVEGWEGTIVGNPPDAQWDDYFVLAGDFPVGYGIDSLDPTIASQLESLRDTQTTIRVWGQVTCPAIDSYGTHIVVTRIEVEGEALTLEALKNAEYQSEWPADGLAKLTDGEYEEEIVPGAASKLIIVFYRDIYAFGDLDGDGVEDAAVVLATSGGGSGTFISLEAVINDKGTPNHVATASLGDRVEVKSVAIESGKITVDMVTHGPDDPMCCPTLEATQKYRLQGDKLVQISNEG